MGEQGDAHRLHALRLRHIHCCTSCTIKCDTAAVSRLRVRPPVGAGCCWHGASEADPSAADEAHACDVEVHHRLQLVRHVRLVWHKHPVEHPPGGQQGRCSAHVTGVHQRYPDEQPVPLSEPVEWTCPDQEDGHDALLVRCLAPPRACLLATLGLGPQRLLKATCNCLQQLLRLVHTLGRWQGEP
jgi:hypothetical protein